MTQVFEYKQKLYNQRRASYILSKIKQLRQHILYEQQEQMMMNERGRIEEIYAKNNCSNKLQCENINEQALHFHPDQPIIANSMVIKHIQSYMRKYIQQYDLKNSLISALKKQQSIDYCSIYQNILSNIALISTNCNHSNMQEICEVLSNLSAYITNDSDALGIQQPQSKQLEWSVKSIYFQYCTFACFLLGLLSKFQIKFRQNDELIDKMQQRVVLALFKCLLLNQATLNEIILSLLIDIYRMKPCLLSSKYNNKRQVIGLLEDLLLQIAEVEGVAVGEVGEMGEMGDEGNKQKLKITEKIQQYERYKYIPKQQGFAMFQQQLAIIILECIDINTLQESLANGLLHKIMHSNTSIIAACMQRVATIPNKQLREIIEQTWRQQTLCIDMNYL